jgi:hypothetical protein
VISMEVSDGWIILVLSDFETGENDGSDNSL